MAIRVVAETANVRPRGLGVRHAQTALLFFGMLLAFTMRVNMSIAIVDMTTTQNNTQEEPPGINDTAIFTNTDPTTTVNLSIAIIDMDMAMTENEIYEKPLEENGTLNFMDINSTITTRNDTNTHFDWSHGVQSVILSSFFWGYVILQVPAGELARKFGGKQLILISMGVNTLVSFAIPFAAPLGGWILLCACRVTQGLGQALIYPCMHHLISQWIPLEEKGVLTTIIYAGSQLGIAFQMLLSGFLAMAWGWQSIFYMNGILGAMWTILYGFYGSNSPEQSLLMSKQELQYIQTSLGRVGEQKRYPAPWLKIMTSLPFWAVIVAHCGQNWGFFTLMTEMPTYMAKVLHVNLKNNGMLSSLPYLAMYLLSFPMGAMTDVIIRKKWLNITHTRKLFNSIGLWGPAIALIGLSYSPEDNAECAVAMLTISVGINAGQFLGYMLVHIDLAPNFSASLMGITNFLANIISIIAPLVCGFIIQDETDPAEWRKVFFVASGVYFFTNLFFVLFATSERQPWNEPELDDVEMKAEKPVPVDIKQK